MKALRFKDITTILFAITTVVVFYRDSFILGIAILLIAMIYIRLEYFMYNGKFEFRKKLSRQTLIMSSLVITGASLIVFYFFFNSAALQPDSFVSELYNTNIQNLDQDQSAKFFLELMIDKLNGLLFK
ncbi:hypothetical protein QQ008_21650 [Fulvivirgaceae bacterium BMA10]|uniref:AI-2E family transporter n=1 Tax=Splendidivirga corallicola TaxID=3051826 RepID=A0ABT8KTE2_9BACT|nr:hypothetical protein [Fulvivirgaceae bacterium BMA10]